MQCKMTMTESFFADNFVQEPVLLQENVKQICLKVFDLKNYRISIGLDLSFEGPSKLQE